MSILSDRSKTFILSAAALVFALFVAEIGLRVYQRVVSGIPLLSIFPGYRLEPMAYSPFLAFGPRVNFQIPNKANPELARFDGRGFRTTDPISPKPSGEIRIVTLGGSTTEDLWNASGRHWPWILEQHLDSVMSGSVRVLNGGMSAYATPHSLIRTAFDVSDLDADVLVVMHNINDLTVVYHAIATNAPVDGHYTAKYLQRSYTGLRGDEDVVWLRIVRFVAGRLSASSAPDVVLVEDDAKLAEGMRLFQRNLKSIAAVARAHGTDAVFLTMPFSRSEEHFRTMQEGQIRVGSVGVGQLPTLDRFLRDMDRYNQAGLEVASEIGVPVIDMASLGPWGKELFVDSVHLSDAGSAAFAARLAGPMRSILDRTAPARTTP